MIFLTRELLGQGNNVDVAGEIQSRSEQIQFERLRKDAAAIPQNPTASTAKRFTQVVGLFRRTPLRIYSSGLGPGEGVAIGAVLQSGEPGDRFISRLWGSERLHNFYSVGAGLWTQDFVHRDLALAFEAAYSDAPQLPYYGQGPNSSIHNRTDYRREDTRFDFRAALRTGSHATEACRLRQLLINVGPGTDGNLPSTESVFGPSEAPGIDVQSNFFISGCSAEIDLRDFPEDPHKGAYVAVAYDRYNALDDDQFSFHRLSAVVEHNMPFWNRKRVVAIRAKTNFSLHSANQVVPFYLNVTLGSDTDLRGFRRYRFYDENSISLTAEYRWEIGSGIDAALFADGGRVFHRPGDIGLSNLEKSGGFGLRFKNRTSVLARLDMGFSREGFQVWLKFGKLF